MTSPVSWPAVTRDLNKISSCECFYGELLLKKSRLKQGVAGLSFSYTVTPLYSFLRFCIRYKAAASDEVDYVTEKLIPS